MQALPKSRLLRFVEQAFHLARRAVARYSSKFSKRRYSLHQHIVLLCLKVRKNTTYRTLLDELIEMPRIRSAIDLEELPSPSTLCKAFSRLDMAVWRVLLNLSVTLLPTNGVVGIDASGFDRSHASKHLTCLCLKDVIPYARRPFFLGPAVRTLQEILQTPLEAWCC